MAEIYCEIVVAIAAPVIPQLKTSTNRRSSPILSTAEIPRNHKGATEFPTALSKQAKKLY